MREGDGLSLGSRNCRGAVSDDRGLRADGCVGIDSLCNDSIRGGFAGIRLCGAEIHLQKSGIGYIRCRQQSRQELRRWWVLVLQSCLRSRSMIVHCNQQSLANLQLRRSIGYICSTHSHIERGKSSKGRR